MASIPHFYSDFGFPDDLSSLFPNPLYEVVEDYSITSLPEATTLSNCSMVFNDYNAFDVLSVETPMSDVDVLPAPAMFFPERFGIPDSTKVSESILPDQNNKITVFGNANNIQYGYRGHEFGEECCGFSPDLKPVMSPVTGENWQIQGGKRLIEADETNAKVGKYSVEERKDRILRYLKKRNQRNFNKTIKYACRKTLADRRVRIRGRFARNNELSQQETSSKKNHNEPKKEEMYFGDDSVQMEYDDGWLKEAMSNLIYLPYNSYVPADCEDDHKTWSLVI